MYWFLDIYACVRAQNSHFHVYHAVFSDPITKKPLKYFMILYKYLIQSIKKIVVNYMHSRHVDDWHIQKSHLSHYL